MKKKQNTTQIIENIKSTVNGLNPAEKENFRDHLLAYLLFGEQTPEPGPENENLKGLTASERALIRKLAAETEALYRAMNRDIDAEE